MGALIDNSRPMETIPFVVTGSYAIPPPYEAIVRNGSEEGSSDDIG